MITSGMRLILFIVGSVLMYKRLGPVGIALADTLAISTEVVLHLYLLNRHFSGLLQFGWTPVRVVMGATGSALLAYLAIRYLDVPVLPLTLGALAVGAAAMLPFAWPEVKGLVKL